MHIKEVMQKISDTREVLQGTYHWTTPGSWHWAIFEDDKYLFINLLSSQGDWTTPVSESERTCSQLHDAMHLSGISKIEIFVPDLHPRRLGSGFDFVKLLEYILGYAMQKNPYAELYEYRGYIVLYFP